MTTPEISEAPLMSLFGSKAAYQVLMYLDNYDKGYATKIAKTFDMSLNQVQKQLTKFEESGLLISRKEGTARVFYFKRSPVTDELRVFLNAMLKQLPVRTVNQFYRQRTRPRRTKKA